MLNLKSKEMKKLFVFAIAAVAMTVACQKNQDVNLGAENEGDLVEMRFNSNLVTVETKGVESLVGQDLFVYGLSDKATDPRQFINVPASVDGEGKMSLDKTYFYGPNRTYTFYGYCLNGATADGTAYNVATSLTITGANDVLLAAAEGSFSATTARAGTHPELEFGHALSRFTFAVANLGNTDMKLSGISVSTPLEGTITFTGTQGVAAGATDGTITLGVSEMTLTAQPSATDPVFAAVEGVEALVFPGSSYTINVTLTQDDADSRTLAVPVPNPTSVEAGFQYAINLKVYSLEEIVISATLKGWEDGQDITVDTSDLEEEGE